MSERGGPERVARHENDIDNDGHYEACQRYPDGHVGLAGKFVPHRDIEKHTEEHVGEQHYRDYSHAGAEIFSYYQ